MYYEMYLSSSDDSIMSTPTVTVPYRGRLSTDWIQFNIRFPCKKKKAGIVTMGIVMDFFYDSQHTQFFKRIDLSMKRQCEKAKPRGPILVPVEEEGCYKRCDLTNLKRKYCLSDFVARIKVNEAVLNTPNPHYLVHIPRKRIFKKPFNKKIIMKKRNQKILAHGDTLTCDCKPLQAGKRYLVFGREDLNSSLYFDSYSIAFEVNKNDEHSLDVLRGFRRDYRSIKCPSKLYRYFRRHSYYQNKN